MKKKILLILLLFNLILSSTYGQTHNYIRLLDEANLAFSNGNYHLADSLYTICAPRSTNGDIFFNRAHARLLMNDSSGYCADLSIAGINWSDTGAYLLFNSNCYDQIDTFYYDASENQVPQGQKYRYYQIAGKLKFDKETVFNYHDMKNTYWHYVVIFDKRLVFLPKPIGSSIVASGYVDSVGKVFNYIHDYDLTGNIKKHFNSYMIRTASYLTKKYPSLWDTDRKKVVVEIQMDTNGAITSANVVQDEYFNNSFPDFQSFCEDIRKTYLSIEGLKPVKFWGQAVRVEMYVYFEIFE